MILQMKQVEAQDECGVDEPKSFGAYHLDARRGALETIPTAKLHEDLFILGEMGRVPKALRFGCCKYRHYARRQAGRCID